MDFIRIVRGEGRDRREAIDRISGVLRDTAKALQIPFVVASQLARSEDEREPRMQDLKESGGLEQDAHNIILLHRPKEKGNWTSEDKLIIAKQREGVIGNIAVTYDERTLSYKPRSDGEEQKATPISFSARINMPSLLNEYQNFVDDVSVGGFSVDFRATEHTRIGSL